MSFISVNFKEWLTSSIPVRKQAFVSGKNVWNENISVSLSHDRSSRYTLQVCLLFSILGISWNIDIWLAINGNVVAQSTIDIGKVLSHDRDNWARICACFYGLCCYSCVRVCVKNTRVGMFTFCTCDSWKINCKYPYPHPSPTSGSEFRELPRWGGVASFLR